MILEQNTDRWFQSYERSLEKELEGAEEVDLEEILVPAHPDPDAKYLIAVNFPWKNLNKLGTLVPRPSYTVVDGGTVQAVWMITDPVKVHADDPDANKKPFHTWKHVSAVLKNVLEGKQVHDKIVNLQAVEHDPMIGLEINYGPQMEFKLKDLKAFWVTKPELKATFYKNSYDTDEARRIASMTRTQAQTEARRANMAKRREAAAAANRARGIAKAEKVMALLAEGLTNAQLAEALGISVHSVQTTVARARKTLGLEEAEVSPRKPEPVVERPLTIDEMVALAESVA
jgi:DNA-binding CsgD family transcriptional regulator